MIALYVALSILAVWRLTYDFINLDGPLGLYRPIKAWIEKKRGVWPEWIIEGFSCYHCCSWWAGFVVCLLIPGLSWRDYLLISLSSSGAVTLFARYAKAMYGADLFE